MRASRSCELLILLGCVACGDNSTPTGPTSGASAATPSTVVGAGSNSAALPSRQGSAVSTSPSFSRASAAAVAPAAPALPQGFTVFRPKERLFELMMPSDPKETVRSANAPSGDVVSTHVATGVAGSSGFTVIWQDNTAGTGASADLFERIRAQKAETNVIHRERRVRSAAGLDALELEMTTKASKHVLLLVFASGNVIYNLLAIDAPPAQAQAFFDSFKLL